MKIRILTLALIFSALCQPALASANGYEETVRVWRKVSQEVSQYRLLLQELYAGAESSQRRDRNRTNSEFARRLAEEYPGSNFFAGSHGSLAVNNYTTIFFDTSWNIVRLRQKFGSLEKDYDFRTFTFAVSDGPNRVTYRLDLSRPEKSLFTGALIPAIIVDAEQIWSRRKPVVRSSAPLKDLLNDVYAYRLAGTGIRMDKLAEELVTSTEARTSFFKAAEEVYAGSASLNRPRASGLFAPNPLPSGSNQHPATPSFSLLGRLLAPLILFGLFLLALRIVIGRVKRKARRKLKGLLPALWKWLRNGSTELPSRGKPDEDDEDWFGTRDEQPLPRVEKPREWSTEVLRSLEWKRFETVCAEYFRLIGYDPRETRIGADGGIDIWVYKNGTDKPVGIVQCKAWTNKVGVKPVRELYGVMAAEGVGSGKLITGGEFTSEALQFAEGKRVQLISGEVFIAGIRKMSAEKQKQLLELATEGDYRTPTCPRCGIKMKLKKGNSRDFWGCTRFPKCRSTLAHGGRLNFFADTDFIPGQPSQIEI